MCRFHIFMKSFSPELTSVKSSIILLVLTLSQPGSAWSSISSLDRMAWGGMGRQVVLGMIGQAWEIFFVVMEKI